jgi:hypothetical protein
MPADKAHVTEVLYGLIADGDAGAPARWENMTITDCGQRIR